LLMHNKTVGFGRRIIRGGRLLPSAERLAKLISERAVPESPTPARSGPAVDVATRPSTSASVR
ncbi:MAG TPA: hypothetical protein VKJ07_20800, partial [Mycobacteriales bacterium]|nr:hypothetical protein [Mycobacteriales bacterium]